MDCGYFIRRPKSEFEGHRSTGPPIEVRIHQVVVECVRSQCGALQGGFIDEDSERWTRVA